MGGWNGQFLYHEARRIEEQDIVLDLQPFYKVLNFVDQGDVH
jgi:hypothetical protein